MKAEVGKGEGRKSHGVVPTASEVDRVRTRGNSAVISGPPRGKIRWREPEDSRAEGV